ncbi:uncharacterized protein BCR38DRAFT_218966 [Pseudomassariella vexata]|uniref:Uncharacterized protein n=1 Tax=Pseudomassariella vexata TaxID=1141098 RepID=A0A1Y2DV35_9PEZI|nr:uncharacterized protein BCR38DRAFT_218966 [Pseudomassariella vexata]ORY62996.1 hypothetical protein BCR38DRAFT_218966 [Pseudomassariella vexata]
MQIQAAYVFVAIFLYLLGEARRKQVCHIYWILHFNATMYLGSLFPHSLRITFCLYDTEWACEISIPCIVALGLKLPDSRSLSFYSGRNSSPNVCSYLYNQH